MLCVRGAPLCGSPLSPGSGRGRRHARRCPRACRVIGLFVVTSPRTTLPSTRSLLLSCEGGWAVERPVTKIHTTRQLEWVLFSKLRNRVRKGWLRRAVRRLGYQRTSGRCHVVSNVHYCELYTERLVGLSNILGYDSVHKCRYCKKMQSDMCWFPP